MKVFLDISFLYDIWDYTEAGDPVEWYELKTGTSNH